MLLKAGVAGFADLPEVGTVGECAAPISSSTALKQLGQLTGLALGEGVDMDERCDRLRLSLNQEDRSGTILLPEGNDVEGIGSG